MINETQNETETTRKSKQYEAVIGGREEQNGPIFSPLARPPLAYSPSSVGLNYSPAPGRGTSGRRSRIAPLAVSSIASAGPITHAIASSALARRISSSLASSFRTRRSR